MGILLAAAVTIGVVAEVLVSATVEAMRVLVCPSS